VPAAAAVDVSVGDDTGVVVDTGGVVVDTGRLVVGVVAGVDDFVAVGVFVGVGFFVGVDDFDADADAFPVVGTTLMPGIPPPTLLPGCDALGEAPVLWAVDCDDVWVGAVVLVPMFAELLPLLEINTAIIATMPMAAAPIPANKKVRDPLPRGGGIRWASF
jgi:hypothetical protein